MAETLRGKTALVTGSAVRVGKAIALALAQQGTHVVVHYHHSREEARQTAQEVRGLGVKCWTVEGDLSREEEAAGVFERAARESGPIDYLVNNASIFESSRVTEFSGDDLWRNLRVNTLAPLVLSRALARQGRPGVIVNILDTAMVRYDAGHVAYHLSKRMLWDLTRMLAMELAPRVRVNAVAPGFMLAPKGAREGHLERLARETPLGHAGNPGMLTEAVVFLLVGQYVTGQVIFVDGGMHMKGRMYD